MNYIRSQARGTTLENRDVQESGFDLMELWVMGPLCGLKAGGVLSFAHEISWMSKGSMLVMSATTSVPRARDEENHFPTR